MEVPEGVVIRTSGRQPGRQTGYVARYHRRGRYTTTDIGSIGHGDSCCHFLILTTRSAISTIWTLAVDTPEIHRGISTPRSPGFGAQLQISRVLQGHRAQEPEIAGGKGIRFAQRSHRHVLRSPLPDAGDFTEPIQKRLGAQCLPSKLILPLQTARARARMVSTRAPVSPMSPSGALARTSGAGKI